MLEIVIISFVMSWLSTLLFIRHLHHVESVAAGGQPEKREPQRYHVGSIPRVGGGPLIVGFSVGLGYAVWKDWATPWWFAALFAVVLPTWGGGAIEDITRRLGPLPRLALSIFSGVLAVVLLDADLPRLDIPGYASLIEAWPFVSSLVVVVAVAGMPHAMNIIDGFNGLAGMVAMLILGAIGYVAFKLGDSAVLAVCLALGMSTAGFFVWNFPKGLIFAGDGGAYLWGCVIAIVSILLVQRNPVVSPWFPALLCIYPVWETVFSIYRKKVLQGRSPFLPDGLHLHMLIFKRLVRWMVQSPYAQDMLTRNSLTAPYLWVVAIFCVVPALMFWSSTPVLMVCCALFLLGYLWLYRRLVRFRSPKPIQLHKR